MTDKKISILLIEDSKEDIELLKMAFKSERFLCQLQVARDGEEALQIIQSSESVPHLIILDMNLPGASGPEILKILRAQEKYDKMPVLIMTTVAPSKEMAEIEQFPKTHIKTKPFEFSEYKNVVNTIRDLVNSK